MVSLRVRQPDVQAQREVVLPEMSRRSGSQEKVTLEYLYLHSLRDAQLYQTKQEIVLNLYKN